MSDCGDSAPVPDRAPPQLKFPRRDYAWDFDRRAVKFWGLAVLCRATLAALRDHFQPDADGGPLAKEALAINRLASRPGPF